MESLNTIAVRIEGPDQAAEARRSAIAIAAHLEFDATDTGRVAVVVTECASNLVKHAGSGEILLRALDGDNPPGIELLALDKGPGMNNVAQCFQDGYSTAGSPGTGLGAIRRLSSECGVYSTVGKGTALLVRIWKRQQDRRCPARPERVEVGAVCVPKTGESACGDGWSVFQTQDYATVMVVDGLGHGPVAADCAIGARQAFQENREESPAGLLSAVHGALRATRGAAVGIARLDYVSRAVRFAGVGNIGGAVYDGPSTRQMISLPGIAGHSVRNVREFSYDWPERAPVLIFSDGLTTHWSLEKYTGLLVHDPSLVAGVLYRDWSRGRDDTTVLVIREKSWS